MSGALDFAIDIGNLLTLADYPRYSLQYSLIHFHF